MLLLQNILVNGELCDILVKGDRISKVSAGGTIVEDDAECIRFDGKKTALHFVFGDIYP